MIRFKHFIKTDRLIIRYRRILVYSYSTHKITYSSNFIRECFLPLSRKKFLIQSSRAYWKKVSFLTFTPSIFFIASNSKRVIYQAKTGIKRIKKKHHLKRSHDNLPSRMLVAFKLSGKKTSRMPCNAIADQHFK